MRLLRTAASCLIDLELERGINNVRASQANAVNQVCGRGLTD